MDLEPEGIVPPDTDVVVGNDPVIREIEKLLEEGKLDAALREIDDAISSGRGNEVDLAFLRGDCCLGLGLSAEAEQQFRIALKGDPDCPSSRCWLAMSLYLQWRFDEAEQAVQAARELPDALVDADVVAGCLAERRAQYTEADGLFARAAMAAPDKYSTPPRLTREAFDEEVQRAVALLPPQFQECLARVSVVVQELPDGQFAAAVAGDGVTLSPDMLGMFDGLPLPDEKDAAGAPRPTSIYLFQRNLERMALGRADLSEQIRITLWHELGHYLGFEEEDMHRLGLE